MVEGIHDSFHPAGDAELIENMKNMVFYGMFAQFEKHRDISIRHSLRQQSQNLMFPCGKDWNPFCVHDSAGFRLS